MDYKIPLNKNIFKEFQTDRNVALYKLYKNYKRNPNKKISDLEELFGISKARIYVIVNRVQEKLNSGEISL